MSTHVWPTPSPSSERYWCELKDLSNDVKLELISLLSSSMREPEDDWTKEFAGKWQDDRTTDEILDDIHSARNAKMREIVL